MKHNIITAEEKQRDFDYVCKVIRNPNYKPSHYYSLKNLISFFHKKYQDQNKLLYLEYILKLKTEESNN